MTLKVWNQNSGYKFDSINEAVSVNIPLPIETYSIINISRSNNIVTIVTQEAINLIAGDQFSLTCTSNSAYSIKNGTVINKLNATSFTYRLEGSNLSPTSASGTVKGLFNYKVVSGQLPPGLFISGTDIIGAAFQVPRSRDFKFVIRASRSSDNTISDRTFVMPVDGADEPSWITPAGLLPIGANDLTFILDNIPIDYQLLATDPDLPSGQTLKYILKEGSLPPGISLSDDGRLTGIISCLPYQTELDSDGTFDSNLFDSAPYDFTANNETGFSSFPYDSEEYDYSIPIDQPRRLNRYYEFIVSVTDYETTVDRTFKIYVVADDFFTVDNTIMKIADGIYTADSTRVRTPVWLTASDLGLKRANNYFTLYLDTLQNCDNTGKILYTLEPVNPDGTPSLLPPGCDIDSLSGEIFGYVKRQPAVTKEYKFTVTATSYDPDQLEPTVIYAYVFETVMRGDTGIKLYDPFSIDGTLSNQDADSLIGHKMLMDETYYTIVSYTKESDHSFFNFDRPVDVDDVTGLYDPDVVGFDWSGYSATETITDGVVLAYDALSGSTEIIITPLTLPRSRVESKYFNWNGVEYRFGNVRDLPLSLGPYQAITITNVERPELGLESDINEGQDLLSFIPKKSETGTGDTLIKKLVLFASEGDTVSDSKTFTIDVLGEIDTSIQWITDPYLGNIKTGAQSILNVQAESLIDNNLITYSLISNRYNTDGRLNRLPPGLSLTRTGNIAGTVNLYGSEIYSSIPVKFNLNSDIISIPSTFSSTIAPGWTIEDANLPGGHAEVTFVNGSKVFLDKLALADQSSNSSFIKTPNKQGIIRFYDTVNGQKAYTSFDNNLTTIDRSYTFTVEAKDQFNYSITTRTFRIDVDISDTRVYSNVYIQPLPKQEKREKWIRFVTDPNIFDPSILYRQDDPSFGVQKEQKMLLFAGIETKQAEIYADLAETNFKRRRLNFGKVKTAQAKKAGSTNVEYEIVYVELIDPYAQVASSIKIPINDNNKKLYVNNITYNTVEGPLNDRIAELSEPYPMIYRPSFPDLDIFSNVITVDSDNLSKVYPASIKNMRNKIKQAGVSNQEFLPLWMLTPQPGTTKILGYTLAVPICYCKPGQSARIMNKIKLLNFDFKTFDFEFDRYVITAIESSDNPRYIKFNSASWNV